ncbi:MAG: FAD-binding oxidoreductase [Methylococcales bacterium]|nr:FAD-binding oxidoreductase [Methylococcales bacterium]
MSKLTLNGVTFTSQPNETVLDTLLRENIQIPNGCRQGICQSCLMRSVDVPPPVSAQVGLNQTQQKQNYFHACVCYPEQDMMLALLESEQTIFITARVIQKQLLTVDIVRVIVECDTNLTFFAGQFVNLLRDDGLTRSYSIANRPQADNRLEFHIRRLPNGQFSNWVHDELVVGSTLTLSEPKGSCHYLSGSEAQPLLLIGTGSGLAPLCGIISDALEQSHSGDIHLFHGSRHHEGLYLVDEMRELAIKHANFYYTPCLSGDNVIADTVQGRAHDVALSTIENLKGWRVYLCGHPDMVNHSKRLAYLKGASIKDIYADAFHVISPDTK